MQRCVCCSTACFFALVNKYQLGLSKIVENVAGTLSMGLLTKIVSGPYPPPLSCLMIDWNYFVYHQIEPLMIQIRTDYQVTIISGKASERGRTSIVWSVPHVLSVPPVNYILNYDGFYVEIIVPGTEKSMWTLTRRIMKLHQIIQKNFF